MSVVMQKITQMTMTHYHLRLEQRRYAAEENIIGF